MKLKQFCVCRQRHAHGSGLKHYVSVDRLCGNEVNEYTMLSMQARFPTNPPAETIKNPGPAPTGCPYLRHGLSAAPCSVNAEGNCVNLCESFPWKQERHKCENISTPWCGRAFPAERAGKSLKKLPSDVILVPIVSRAPTGGGVDESLVNTDTMVVGFMPKLVQHAYPACVGDSHHSLFPCTSCAWPTLEEWFCDSIPNTGNDQVYMLLFHVMCAYANQKHQAWHGSPHYHMLMNTVLCTMYYVLCTMYYVLCLCLCLCIGVGIGIGICMYVCIYACIHARICMHTRSETFDQQHTHTHTHTHMHTHTHTHTCKMHVEIETHIHAHTK